MILDSMMPVAVKTSDPSKAKRLAAVARAQFPAIRRFLVIAAIAFWMGGFTFYASIAVPTGVNVLGTHRAVGFITQQVTQRLNVAGVAALAVLLWNIISSRTPQRPALRRTLLVTWLLMTLIEIELILLHPAMDRLMITQPVRMILNEDRFELLHRIYLVSTTAQWFLGLVHVWCLCALWGTHA